MFRLSGCSAETTIAMLVTRSVGVFLSCGHCRHQARLGLEALSKLPGGATLAQLAERVRCSECESKDGLLGTHNALSRPGPLGHNA